MNTVSDAFLAATGPAAEAATPAPAPAAGGRHSPEARAAYEANKLSKRLHRQVGQAITDFRMIEDGDKVMVCVSGGKDSYALLDILINLRRRAPVRFDLVAVNLDQKQPGFPAEVLPAYLGGLGVPFHIENQDTYSIVKRLVPEGQTMCSLCSRLRRGILYRVASELGATKIALGHHRDDMVQTLFMNMFFGGRMKGMPPKLVSDDGRHVVIRPLAYVAETDLERWAAHRAFPIIPCTLCGNQENLQRVQMKQMLRDWEARWPGRIDNLFNAMGRVVPSHLMDRNLYPFETLQATGVADPDGDHAFDEERIAAPGAPADAGCGAGAAPSAGAPAPVAVHRPPPRA
ncbi:tRNA 2-thiocytidine(32) synthetase TtcA [Piscinibacter sakaiensis]|uniref:tRNA-cytidine(32) 2-sulfurtransferase n=1 Tax=Piscinibacter sakaiensis TaxID=1547922 RepID=A0A0K8P592_PISS1|nr:tRNA 2-thiocytidine(32) synthetase TtcA [Piscinibacter sakaiensis]GAP37746.1 tRNA(cytosine32)-2-thiocytidine synthetase [Piscinibacter sakaiensis]